MADRGPWQRALDLRADTPHPDRIDDAAREWRSAARVLTSAAEALERHAPDTERIGVRSGPAIRTSFAATAVRMTQQAETLDKGAAALGRAHRAVLAARAGRDSDERGARELVEAFDAAFRRSAAALAEIHGPTTPTPDAVPADPTGTPPGPSGPSGPSGPTGPQPTPDSVRAPVPDRGEQPVPSRTTGPGVDLVDQPSSSTTRPEVAAAAPAVLGGPAPVVAAAAPADISLAEAVAGVTAGGLLAVSGPAVLRRAGAAAPTGARSIGADVRPGTSAALVPGSPVARAGGRTGGAVAPAAGTARPSRGKRRAKPIRPRTPRIGRRRREDPTRKDEA